MSKTPVTRQVTKRPGFGNAPGFRATGRGYFNAIPNFPANASNGNGMMLNKGLPEGNRNRQMWLFVTGVQTGWQIAGQYGQTAGSRTFYPNNLSQSPIVIEGVVANQYEYDRIAEFVVKHHQQALATFDNDPNAGAGDATQAIEFNLYPYRIDTGRKTAKGEPVYREVYGGLPGAGQVGSGANTGTRFQGYITSFQAGAQKFVNAPTFQLGFQVSYDFLSDPVNLTGMFNTQLFAKYKQSFGQTYSRADARGSHGQIAPGNGFVSPSQPSQPDIWTQPTQFLPQGS